MVLPLLEVHCLTFWYVIELYNNWHCFTCVVLPLAKGRNQKRATSNIYVTGALFITVDNWKQLQHKILKEQFGKLRHINIMAYDKREL